GSWGAARGTGHCSMARVPTIAEEDAKRPNRERECLVGERTRIVNRMKATLARFGVRNFKPTLRKAAERLATVHTQRARGCREMYWPSCSATWRGWALSSARSGRSSRLVRNDWSRLKPGAPS